MSLAANSLRRRKSINETRAKIGTHQKELLYQHDYFTFFYVGISFMVSFFDYGGLIISLLYFIDIMLLENMNKASTKTQMKKSYQINLLCTGLLALSSSISNLKNNFQLHMITCIVPVTYIIHRRNPKNILIEFIWVLSWLLLKIGLAWISTFQYMHVSGEMYSKWLMSKDKTPIKNPWTNPPIIFLTLISFTNSVTNLIQSYYVMVHNKKII